MTTTRNRLLEIEKLLNKAQGLLKTVVDSQPKPTPGKPPQPYWTQKVATNIWNAWDKLKEKGRFDAREAQKIATSDKELKHYRIDTSYSAILSRWAAEGYLDRVEEGSGPNPAIYKIPS
jgi:hypothetical protein